MEVWDFKWLGLSSHDSHGDEQNGRNSEPLGWTGILEESWTKFFRAMKLDWIKPAVLWGDPHQFCTLWLFNIAMV